MRDPHKGHEALRRGRVSVPNGEYFLTLSTDDRRIGLTSPLIALAILREMQRMMSDRVWQVRCATIMPDHVHALVVLGERLSLGKAIARLKAKLCKVITDSSSQWERDFFDRHVRPDDDRVALFLYIFPQSISRRSVLPVRKMAMVFLQVRRLGMVQRLP
jgi:REP element-mobilizing transposase RayT